MQQLNLPTFDVKVENEKIFCVIRKKWIVLTPEEWVRQHFLNLMINHLNYPKGMMRLEQNLKYFKNEKRSDIVLQSRDAGIFMVVECKAANVPIDQKVVNQISTYNKILKGKYLVVTNGLKHFIWVNNQDKYDQQDQFPAYQ